VGFLANANARAAMLLEREMDRKHHDINREMAEENRRLAQEQESHKQYLEKEVYTNPPNASYFMQFNTSTR
jgi:F0F1-type ATP synthase membrane subunit b/b'